MSNEINIEADVENIQQNAFVPAFFEKLAAYNIQPATQQEAEALLEMGIQLHAAAQTQKNASANNSLILCARDGLKETFGLTKQASYDIHPDLLQSAVNILSTAQEA